MKCAGQWYYKNKIHCVETFLTDKNYVFSFIYKFCSSFIRSVCHVRNALTLKITRQLHASSISYLLCMFGGGFVVFLVSAFLFHNLGTEVTFVYSDEIMCLLPKPQYPQGLRRGVWKSCSH